MIIRRSRVLIFVFVQVAFVQCSEPCTNPVDHFTNGIKIIGPCPSELVTAPIYSIVLFRCDYKNQNALAFWEVEDVNTIRRLFQWTAINISSGINVTFQSGTNEGFTEIHVLVLHKYLNSALRIKCGLCYFSNNGDCEKNRLYLSKDVVLVAFGNYF